MRIDHLLLFLLVTFTFGGVIAHAATTEPAQKPTLFIIGDSTVKNGRDDGSNGQWGWGHILPFYFDPKKITVENDALGGTSSRTFFQTPKLWPATLNKIRPGDFLLLQFGHNDNTRPPESDTLRYRSTLPGNGEDTVEGPKSPSEKETIHSYGWYLRQIIQQTKDKGATPIVCSLIPRNSWHDAKITRSPYAQWAREAADQVGTTFLPLNEIIADKYDELGEEKVTSTFFPANEHTHTNWQGAKLNAQCVVQGIRQLPNVPLKNFLLPNPPEIPTPPPPSPHIRPAPADPELPK